MTAFHNGPKARTKSCHRLTPMKFENRLSPTGLHGRDIQRVVAGDIPKIHASLKGQN